MSMGSTSHLMTTVGFTEQRVVHGRTVSDRIYDSWVNYLQRTLGRSPDFAHQRADKERTRSNAKNYVKRLRSSGWHLKGTKIIDIGSGHGSLAVELALAGAEVTAVEPSRSWRELSEERAREFGLEISHSPADAHALPFPDDSFDGLVSLQVLEHVREPTRVISEMSRILKPGGRFFVSCENYLAFWEDHYGVAWMPILPKFVGSIYLRLLGRDSRFLREHVTYTYWPLLAKSFLDVGLIDRSWLRILNDLTQNVGTVSLKTRLIYGSVKRLFGESWARPVIIWGKERHKLFRVGFQIIGRKHGGDSWCAAKGESSVDGSTA